MKKLIGAILAVGLGAGSLLASGGPANAAAGTVSTTPASWTPYITNADVTVRKLLQCGSTMYVVGDFTSIGSPVSGAMTRNRAFSFNATTGAVTSWNPNVNGSVSSITLSADCATAYLAGTFTQVHGTAVKNLAKVNTTNGAVDTAFVASPSANVATVVLTHGHLLAGGNFASIGGVSRPAMASLNPATGKADSYVNLNITGSLARSTRKVFNFSLSHDGNRLLVMGSFLNVGGVDRQQIFMLDLGTTSTAVDPWNSSLFSIPCKPYLAFFIQAATWSADDQFVYTATTGRIGGPLCDTVARYPSASNPDTMPLWSNATGCDSLFSVAADDDVVYAGGHQRWMNNEGVCEVANPDSVGRQGVAAVSNTTGRAVDWNPGRARGHGADDMLLTAAGLWIASDTYDNATTCAGAYHPGLCFLPR